MRLYIIQLETRRTVEVMVEAEDAAEALNKARLGVRPTANRWRDHGLVATNVTGLTQRQVDLPSESDPPVKAEESGDPVA